MAWPQKADHTRALPGLGTPQQGGGSNVLTTDRGRRAAPRIWLKSQPMLPLLRPGGGRARPCSWTGWAGGGGGGGLLLAAGAVDQPFKASISCIQRASPLLVQLTLPARPQEPYQEVCQAWAPFQFRSWPRPSVSAEINQQSRRSHSVGPLSASSSPHSCGTAEQADWGGFPSTPWPPPACRLLPCGQQRHPGRSAAELPGGGRLGHGLGLRERTRRQNVPAPGASAASGAKVLCSRCSDRRLGSFCAVAVGELRAPTLSQFLGGLTPHWIVLLPSRLSGPALTLPLPGQS